MISNPLFCPQCGTALEVRPMGDRERPVCPGCGFIFYINPLVAVGALVEHEGKVALVRRGVEPGRGYWGLPAGYVEADESAEEAAVRETAEEAHLAVEVDGLLDAFSYGIGHNRGVLLIYAAHLVAGEIVGGEIAGGKIAGGKIAGGKMAASEIAAGDDAVDAGWFGPDELPEIAFRTHRAVLHQWRQARAVVYRPATLADAEVVTMLSEVYPTEASGSCARQIGSPGRQLYVALDKGQVIGFCGMAQDADTCTGRIVQVFVHPRYRRWGIGTHLLTCCVEESRKAGLRALQAQAPITNPGWGVYLKAGFRASGLTTGYYENATAGSQTALLLTYDLDENPNGDP